ncbi:MAG TPA: L,D-transpeptidase [Nitrolancea sp.]|nr:L,D-transpeptidase [Nitrolancea sp.]
MTVQYFERARFAWHPENIGTPYAVELGRLGATSAVNDSVNQSAVPRSLDTAIYDPNLWYVPLAPDADDVRAPLTNAPVNQAKWIEVDLSDQYLREWEHSTVVYGAYVSTGVPAHPTPVGMFPIMAQHQSADPTGGTTSAVDMQLPNVPNVMHFYNGFALTGTYWHSAFGTPMTNGSVNLPLQAAEWIYNWAPYETKVWIHE